MPFKRAFKHRWSFDHKSSHTEIWNIWNYWNYCCGIAFVTGINTTICCGLEYLHTIPCCWGSRGREFKSRHSDQKVQIIVWLSVLFYFALNLCTETWTPSPKANTIGQFAQQICGQSPQVSSLGPSKTVDTIGFQRFSLFSEIVIRVKWVIRAVFFIGKFPPTHR